MRELNLDEIKNIQIDLLKNLDAFCQEKGIRYCLCNGTLLGAVKYGGYIPWDDDIDVCLLRDDYERLIAEYKDDDRRKLASLERDRSFLFPFAKLCDEQTILLESNVKKSTFGVNIDIFPIDSFGDTMEEVGEVFDRMQRLRARLNWAKLRVYTSGSLIKSMAKFFFSLRFRLFGAKYYCKKIITLAKRKKGRYYGDVVWGFYGVGEALEKTIFTELDSVNFEGGEYPAPQRKNEYLFSLYGDWRKDPPKEEQRTHHTFRAYLK